MNTLSERRSGSVLPAESAPVGFKRDTALVIVRSERADAHKPTSNGNGNCRASNGSSAEAGSPATTRSHASIDAMSGDQGSQSPSHAKVSQSRRKGPREGRVLHYPGWDSSWDPSIADTGDANSSDSPLRTSSTPRTSCATEHSRGSGSVRHGDRIEGGIDGMNHPRTTGSISREEVSLSPASEESRSVSSQGSRKTDGDAVGPGEHHADRAGDGAFDGDAKSMLEDHRQAKGDGAEDSRAVDHPKRPRKRQTQQQHQECCDKLGNLKGKDLNGHATTPRRDGTGTAGSGRTNPSTPRNRRGGSSTPGAFADEDPSGSKPRSPQTRTTSGGADAASKTPGSARRKLVARSPKVPSDDTGMKQAPAAMITPKKHPEGAGPGHHIKRATPPPFKVGVTPASSDRRGATTKAPTSTPRIKLCTKPALPVEAMGTPASSGNQAKGNFGSGTLKSPTLSQSKAKSPRPGGRQTQLGGKSGDRVSHVTSDVDKSSVEEEIEALLPPRVSAVIPWEKNLRSSDSKSPMPKKTVSGQSPAGRPGKHGNGNLETKRSGRKVQKGTPANRGGNPANGAVRRLLGEDSDGEEDTRGRGRGDGRPSIGTWNKTKDFLQILKEISGKDEEELEWLAVAKKGDGVNKSEKRRESAETQYFRLLCNESMQQAKLELLQDRRVERALKAMVTVGGELRRLDEDNENLGRKEQALEREDEKGELRRTASASRLRRCQERDRLSEARLTAERKVGACLEEVRVGKEKLKTLMGTLRDEVSADEDSASEGGGKGLGRRDALDIVVGVCEDVCCGMEHAVPERAKTGLQSLEEAAKSLREELKRTRSDSQTALTKMEKWRQRKEELPEYEKEKVEKEREWLEREREANGEALKRMRALCPAGVANLTVAQLERRVVEAGSLYPRELAFRLKENRLLQWIVEHPGDIARANFLKGDHAHFFTNLDRYDLVELRAITACLPERFEVDGDGRKAAWRAAFLQRVQGLVAQERGECVTGGWDPEAQQRLVLQLPPLNPEQLRRPEYFYPTKLEVDERLGKLRAREEKLAAKRVQLDKVKDVLLPEAREEYANVLEDTRHPANREMYSADDLRRAREEARAAVDGLAKDVKRLESEVKSTERALAEGPYTVQSLEGERQATLALLKKRASGSRRPRVDLSADRAGRRGLEQQENKNLKDKEKHPDDRGRTVNRENRETRKFLSTNKGVLGNSAVADGDDPDRRECDAGEKGSAAAAKPCPRTEGEATARGKIEVKGPFNPEPELRSRLGDRSCSLKFVTAEEDARMRKEELAKAIGARGAKEDVQPIEVSKKGSSETARKGRKVSSSNDDGGNVVLVGRAKAMHDTRGDGERSRSGNKIKTFGAILEETLSRRIAKSPGTGPADVTGGTPKPPVPNRVGLLSPAARGGHGGMSGVSASHALKVSREKTPVADKRTPNRTLSPACVPKSKLFRSITNPVSPAVGASSALLVPSVPPPLPPPLPTVGSLGPVRAPGRGGGGGGGHGSGTKVMMGGILAEIRARAANQSNCMEKAKVEGRRTAADNTVSSCSPAVNAAGTPKRDPPPLPVPPPLPLQPRSLFGSSRLGESIFRAGTGAAPAGPPPDLLADLRAKAMEKIASRRAAATTAGGK